MEEREKRLVEKEKHLDQREISLGERGKHLDGKEVHLFEKEKRLDGREARLEEREKRLEEREKRLEEGETRLEKRDERLKDRERFLDTRMSHSWTWGHESELHIRQHQLELKVRELEKQLGRLKLTEGSSVAGEVMSKLFISGKDPQPHKFQIKRRGSINNPPDLTTESSSQHSEEPATEAKTADT